MTRWRSIAPTPRSRAPSSPAGVWDTGLRRPKAPFAYARTRPRSRWLRRSTGRRSVPRGAAAMSCSVLQQLFQLFLGERLRFEQCRCYRSTRFQTRSRRRGEEYFSSEFVIAASRPPARPRGLRVGEGHAAPGASAPPRHSLLHGGIHSTVEWNRAAYRHLGVTRFEHVTFDVALGGRGPEAVGLRLI